MYPILFDACNNCGSARNNTINLTCESNHTVVWIYKVFDECVDTPKEEAGFILGLISILCWIGAALPQLVENYRKKHVEEALSLLFLIFWLFGDTSNLVGCLLTRQLTIQIITAVYYVLMDVIMIVQFIYYRERNRRIAKLERNGVINEILANGNGHVRHTGVLACLFFMVILPVSLFRKNFESESFSSYEHRRIGRTLLSSSNAVGGGPLLPTDPKEIIGYVIGCTSSVFYLCSRFPQILKNYKRHQTDGVSIILFLLAVTGNALYGSSILLQDPEAGQTYTQFIFLHLPWLIGSLGTMSLDFILLLQILYYNPPCKKRERSHEQDTEPLLT